MTSKEKTIEKIKNQELHNQRELKKSGKVSIFSQKELHYYKEVLKDLEVLEILKEYLTPHILEELCIEEKEVWEWLKK